MYIFRLILILEEGFLCLLIYLFFQKESYDFFKTRKSQVYLELFC